MQHVPRHRENQEKEMMDYSNSAIREVINEYIHAQIDRDLLCARFIDGLTYEKLSEKYDLSVSQIKRKIYKGESIIFKHLK